ncbi:MAG: hypothetical protein ACOC2E_07810 [Bacteroidota bacterium]
MKLFVRVCMVLSVFFILQSCERKDRPEEVTEKFMNHLMAREYEQAGQYGTESTQKMMQMFETFESLGGDAITEDELQPEKIEDIECEVDGDTAICRFDEEGQQSELVLVKEDNEWLVHIEKENPFGDMDWETEETEEEQWIPDAEEPVDNETEQ